MQISRCSFDSPSQSEYLFLVQGKQYFTCPDNHGIFVRQSQLTVLNDTDSSPPQKPASSKLPTLGIPKPGASRIPGVGTPTKEKVKDEKDEVSYKKANRAM